ncbi:hypothetical protein WR25_15579 [Diploscapter pachys]|uniref:Uncharacterized protein n=1 Tax=Diploscapter pachys TaxID=2018661 RepID=A0A2A2LAG1_9BILA|nr:hypothetical protein WR25_15579 [Diploscapter pachys]
MASEPKLIVNREDETLPAAIDKDSSLVACSSPTPSNSSFLSEQEPVDTNSASRQSPFLSISQASPCSSLTGFFQRPEFLNLPDSETSSRSSLDGSFMTTAERREKFRTDRKRRVSSDSSSSEESVLTTGAESIDGEDGLSRKSSRGARSDDRPPSIGPGARPIDAPRGIIEKIRRESNCSLDNEVTHERLVQASQKVSSGFDDIFIEGSPVGSGEHRHRARSFGVGEPISIVTNNMFMPHSCSPSPTRNPDTHKQCYSPSTQQVVRPNIPYSPSPSPTASPKRPTLISRSASPITSRKRALPSAVVLGDLEIKRACGPSALARTNSTSPLVTDRSFPYPTAVTVTSGSSTLTSAATTSSTAFSAPSPQHQPFAHPNNASEIGVRPLALCRPRRSQPDFDDPLRRSSVDSSCDELPSTPHLSTSDDPMDADDLAERLKAAEEAPLREDGEEL